MELLKQRILTDGKNLGKGILKVDRFINHQVDPILMDACGAEFARLFAGTPAVKILTAEISGIGPRDGREISQPARGLRAQIETRHDAERSLHHCSSLPHQGSQRGVDCLSRVPAPWGKNPHHRRFPCFRSHDRWAGAPRPDGWRGGGRHRHTGRKDL